MSQTLIPTVAAVLSFVTYSLSGHELNVATIFSSLQLFNVIKAPMTELSISITTLSDVHAARIRLTKFMTLEEQAHDLLIDPSSNFAVRASGDFAYETVIPQEETATEAKLPKVQRAKESMEDPDDSVSAHEKGEEEGKPFTLNDIDLNIERGSLCCLFGRIGSGKSALLQALLGEMRQTRGAPVKFGGSVSLVTQTPWIQNASVKDNILFGQDMDRTRLQETIHVCALAEDLSELSDGVDTEIGGLSSFPPSFPCFNLKS
jgi:ATP-binding cassette subfamily C (CFTR/MRP) protein 1